MSITGDTNWGDLVIDGETLSKTPGSYNYNSILIKNSGKLTASSADGTGLTLNVRKDVKLESSSQIDMDYLGYSGGAGGAGGADGHGAQGGFGATKGSAGSGDGAGSGGTNGGNGGCVCHSPCVGAGGGGGGVGGSGRFGATPGAAGTLPNAATYNQATVHAGGGGAGASGGGGGGGCSDEWGSYGAEAGSNGAAGGKGGGYVKIICRNLILDSGTNIYARGETGGIGGEGGDGNYFFGNSTGGGGGGHGAGGGAGGGIHIQYFGSLTINGAITVTGGAGGAGGAGGHSDHGSGADGSTGPAGANGRYYAEVIANPYYADSGLRYKKGDTVYKIACEDLEATHKLRFRKGAVTVGLPLVATDDDDASPIRIYDGSAIKSLAKLSTS